MKWCELLGDRKDNVGIIPWAVPDCEEQARFFSCNVSPFIRKDERVVVIISDGLRYESAVEFTQVLNREFKGKTN